MHNLYLAQLMRSDMISTESNAAGSHLFYRNKQYHRGILWSTGCGFRRKKHFSYVEVKNNEICCIHRISNVKNIHIVKIKSNYISRKRSITNKCRFSLFHKCSYLLFHFSFFNHFIFISTPTLI